MQTAKRTTANQHTALDQTEKGIARNPPWNMHQNSTADDTNRKSAKSQTQVKPPVGGTSLSSNRALTNTSADCSEATPLIHNPTRSTPLVLLPYSDRLIFTTTAWSMMAVGTDPLPRLEIVCTGTAT